MKLNQFFERIVYIPSIYDNWAYIKNQCNLWDIDIIESPVISSPSSPPKNLQLLDKDLTELLSFYNAVRVAYNDNTDSILILSNKVKFRSNFLKHEASLLNQWPTEWNYVYLGYEKNHLYWSQLQTIQTNQLLYKISHADGVNAIALHSSFYFIFLEKARAAITNLNNYLRELSWGANIYASVPPMFLL